MLRPHCPGHEAGYWNELINIGSKACKLVDFSAHLSVWPPAYFVMVAKFFKKKRYISGVLANTSMYECIPFVAAGPTSRVRLLAHA